MSEEQKEGDQNPAGEGEAAAGEEGEEEEIKEDERNYVMLGGTRPVQKTQFSMYSKCLLFPCSHTQPNTQT